MAKKYGSSSNRSNTQFVPNKPKPDMPAGKKTHDKGAIDPRTSTTQETPDGCGPNAIPVGGERE